jgi:hypothetical protein
MALIAALFYRVGVVVFWLCTVGAGAITWWALTQTTKNDQWMFLIVAVALFIFGVIVRYVFSAGNAEARQSDKSGKRKSVGSGVLFWGSMILVMILGKVISQVAAEAWVYYHTKDTGQEIEEAFVQTENELRGQLPKKLDARTTVIAVGHSGKVFVFNVQVDVDRTQVDPNVLRPTLTHAYCQDAYTRKMLKNGATFRAIFVDRKGQSIGVQDVADQTCSYFPAQNACFRIERCVSYNRRAPPG